MPEVGATLDAPRLRRAMTLYLRALEAHREQIDPLNVFPVPDTGTNLLLTQRALTRAHEEARRAVAEPVEGSILLIGVG